MNRDSIAQDGKKHLESLGSSYEERALKHYVWTLTEKIAEQNKALEKVAEIKRDLKLFLKV